MIVGAVGPDGGSSTLKDSAVRPFGSRPTLRKIRRVFGGVPDIDCEMTSSSVPCVSFVDRGLQLMPFLPVAVYPRKLSFLKVLIAISEGVSNKRNEARARRSARRGR